MKSKTNYRLSSKRIRSLHDLELEKAKLEVEILKSEESIRSGYRQVLHRLTFRNLAGSLVEELSSRTSVLATAISVGKSFLEKRKKKKKAKEKAKTEEVAIKNEEIKEDQTKSNLH